MTEIKKPKTNKFEKVSRTGHYIYKNGSYYWEETTVKHAWSKQFRTWEKSSEEISLLKPEDSPAHLQRNANVTILFMKEYDNKNEFNGVEKVWFKMQLDYAIRPDVTNNLWFVESDGKLFIRDLSGQGQCAPVALNSSNENYTCKASKPERITSEQATALVKETGTRYIFSKIEQDSSGNIVSFGQGV